MLSNLVQVEKRVFQTFDKGCHAAKSRSLKLLALEERLSIFE